MNILHIYHKLLRYFGRQNWWSVSHSFTPPELEICIGAILTQNTNWKNVEKALVNMEKSNCTSLNSILEIDENDLKKLIKPVGFFNQKAERVKLFVKYASNFGSFEDFLKKTKRSELLVIKGIGYETADSILLYAANRPYFVVDAYTKRIFSRTGLIKKSWNYETVRSFFESYLPKDIDIYKEFHALIVELGKNICKKRPLCEICPLKCWCRHNLHRWNSESQKASNTTQM